MRVPACGTQSGPEIPDRPSEQPVVERHRAEHLARNQRIGGFVQAALLSGVADGPRMTVVPEIAVPDRNAVTGSSDAPLGIDVVDPEFDAVPVVAARGVENDHVVYADLPDAGRPEGAQRNVLPEFELFVDARSGNQLVDQNAVSGDQRRVHRIGGYDELVAEENPQQQPAGEQQTASAEGPRQVFQDSSHDRSGLFGVFVSSCSSACISRV